MSSSLMFSKHSGIKNFYNEEGCNIKPEVVSRVQASIDNLLMAMRALEYGVDCGNRGDRELFIYDVGQDYLVRLANLATKIYAARRKRATAFDVGTLFGEPAWDMLLDLFIAHVQQKPVSITSASLASAVPSTTALRWIEVLEEAGVIERRPDIHDRRRYYLDLTQLGLDGMIRVLSNYDNDSRDV